MRHPPKKQHLAAETIDLAKQNVFQEVPLDSSIQLRASATRDRPQGHHF